MRSSVTRAPGDRPARGARPPGSTPRRRPAPAASSVGVRRRRVGEEDAGRPGAGDDAGERAGVAARPRARRPAPGAATARPAAGRWRARAPSTSGSRWRSAASSSSGLPSGGRRAAGGAQPVELAVDRPGWTGRRRRSHHPVPGARPGQHRADRLAAAGAQRGAAEHQERHVRAEARRRCSASSSRVSPVPQSASQATSAAAASALPPARPAGERDLLAQVQPGVRGYAGRRAASARAARMTRLSSSSASSPAPSPSMVSVERVAAAGGQLVVEADRVVDGGQLVEAVGAQRADAEVQVDLRGHPDPDRSVRGQARPVRTPRHRSATERLGHVRAPYLGRAAASCACRWLAIGRIVHRELLPAGAAGRRRPPAGSARRRRARRPSRPARPAASCGAGRTRRRPPRTPSSRSTSGGRLAAGERDQAGVHVGHRPEHARRHPAGQLRASAYQASFTAGTP